MNTSTPALLLARPPPASFRILYRNRSSLRGFLCGAQICTSCTIPALIVTSSAVACSRSSPPPSHAPPSRPPPPPVAREDPANELAASDRSRRGSVAEHSTVCGTLARPARICATCGAIPISVILSASSSTKYSSPRSDTHPPEQQSSSRPGAPTTTSAPPLPSSSSPPPPPPPLPPPLPPYTPP